ncbi:hypothetical protein WDU94_010406 [Cyamophila willieti]
MDQTKENMVYDQSGGNSTSSASCIEEPPPCCILSSVESSNSDCAKLNPSSLNKPEEPSCSKDNPSSCRSNTSKHLDDKIKSKISDLNQTFLRIINSLKIMNVHNRNSGRSDLNSNNQILNLFDDFLNISHLLNIKINYLYNTYMSRSEMKKYISAINYKLYVFNINSFELSQGIDKDNKKHKKYQILHDLNISEMTNNVKLFNFVDDVVVNPATKDEPCASSSCGDQTGDRTSEGTMKEEPKESTKFPTRTNPISNSDSTSLQSSASSDDSKTNETTRNNDCTTDKQFTKRLKRKPEDCESLLEESDHVASSSEVTDSAADSNTKKLKTIELNPPTSPAIEEYDSKSVDMFNNLFKEINSNILELSKDIDVLNSYLKLLTPRSQSNEDDLATSDEDELEELKKQTLADSRLKKWQITQMTRSLIDNMVNSIQEEMMSRRNERHERSLVNEAVLMAIQRHGLQREQREIERENSPSRRPDEVNESNRDPSAHARQRLNDSGKSMDTSLERAGTSKEELEFTDKEQRFSMMSFATSSTSSLPNKRLFDQRSSNTDLNKAFDQVQPTVIESQHSDPNDSESDQDGGTGSQNVSNDDLQSSQQVVQSEEQGSLSCPNEAYYDENMSSEALSDDFLTQAVSVAISKKGLST